MFIKAIKIEPQTLVKIYEKHAVLAEEIEKVLIRDKAIFKKAGGDQYIAVGLWDRYLTIFFRHNIKAKEVTITTAYSSSRKQIKSYKKLVR